MVKPEMFQGDDVRQVAKNMLGCVLHFPKSSFPVKEGTITAVQWYDVEGKDQETTVDKQGDALLMTPGKIFIFESMGHVVILVSALSDQTRACVRISSVNGVAERAHLITRALGISTFNRHKYQGVSLLDQTGPLYLTEPTIQVPEPEIFKPGRSPLSKGFRITLPH